MAVIFVSRGTMSGVHLLMDCLYERTRIRRISREDLEEVVNRHGELAKRILERLEVNQGDGEWVFRFLQSPVRPAPYFQRSLEKMNNYLPYDPGVLPSSLAPASGEQIVLRIQGLPRRERAPASGSILR